MKIGIDLCEFKRKHAGGKDEVAYNLLRGFEQLGYSKQIVCFCHRDLKDIIRSISPELEIVTIPTMWVPRRVYHYIRFLEGCYVEHKAKKYGIDVLMFTTKFVPWKHFSIKTVLIPHDIQIFETGRIPGVHATKRKYDVQTRNIRNDFMTCDYIVAISNYDKSEMIRFLPWAEKKIKQIYNPIRFLDIDMGESEKRYITALNIQWPHKNVETLVRAYAKIANEVSVDLMLVGNKPKQFEEVESIIHEGNLESRVQCVGFVAQDELEKIIAKTRVYVLPSYYEGFGMTPIEMIGREVPTITSTTTAIPEVTRGLCRYYEPVDDADALAREILDEIHNPTQAEVLKAAADEVKREYTYTNIAKKYWQLFDEISRSENGNI